MPNTTKGTPYVQSSDLVSAYPTTSLSLANHIDNNLAYNAVTYNNQTGTTYTFVLADASTGRITTASNAAAQTYTIPPQTSVAWATGARIFVTNIGTGALSIAAGAGVTVSNTAAAISQWESVELIRTASDVWAVIRGGLPAVSAPSPGLAFITGTTFTNSTGVNVNNCFTSTYDSYRIMIDATAFSTTLDMLMRLRVSGADNSTTNYVRQVVFGSGSSAVAGLSSSQTSWNILNTGSANAELGKMSLDVFAPNLTRKTVATWIQASVDAPGNQYSTLGNLFFNATTVFDGFSLVPSTGNISGTVRVYGYRNS